MNGISLKASRANSIIAAAKKEMNDLNKKSVLPSSIMSKKQSLGKVSVH